MPRKSVLVILFLLALVPSLRLLLDFSDQPYLGIIHDDSVYWVTAKSIAQSGSYRIESLPEEPYQTKYPPFYPLFLSWIWKLNSEYPANLRLALTAQWLLFPAMLLALYALFRSLKIDGWYAALICLLVAVNPYAGFYGMMLVSELLFLTLFFAALTYAIRARNLASGNLAAIAGLLAAAAYLTRAAGLVLLPAGVIYFLMSRRYKQIIFYSLAMLPGVAAWMLWAHAHALQTTESAFLIYTSYSGDYWSTVTLPQLPSMIWTNWGRFSSAMATLLIPQSTRIPGAQPVAYLLIAASVAGAARLVKRHGWTPMHLFAIGYAAILLLWNWTPSERMTLPLLPLMLAGILTEVQHIGRMFSKQMGRPWLGWAIPAASAVILVASNLYTHWTLVPWLFQTEHRALEANRGAYGWIAEHTNSSATFMTWSDVVLYLNTGRRAIRPPQARIFEDGLSGANAEAALSEWARFAARTGSYLLLSTSDIAGDRKQERLRTLSTMVMAQTRFRPLYQTPDAVILRLEAPR